VEPVATADGGPVDSPGLPTLDMDASVDVRGQLAAIWNAVAELADLAGVNCSAGTRPPALANAGSAAGSPTAGESRDQQAAAVTAAATEAMIGAVRDAIVAISECRRDADSCKRTVGSMAQELLDLRGEWSQIRNRVAGCEKNLGELRAKVVSAVMGAVREATEPTKGSAAATNGDDHRDCLPLEVVPTASPRTPPTYEPETLHPRRTNSPANGSEVACSGNVV